MLYENMNEMRSLKPTNTIIRMKDGTFLTENDKIVKVFINMFRIP